MLDATFYKEYASAAALIMTIALFVPYIRSIKRGTIVPHVFSWLIWAFGTFVVFLAQLAGGAGLGAWPIGFSACITGYIAFLSYQQTQSAHIARRIGICSRWLGSHYLLGCSRQIRFGRWFC